MDNATHIAGSSFAPAAKRQQLQFERDNESDDEACIDDILELLSKNDVVSALDALLSETGSTRGQTTFCENKKNKRKRKARKKKSKKQNSAGSKVLSMKAVVIEIMKYLTIKNIVSDRRINHFLKDLLHFKFMCDNHNVYFEYSNKMLVDITVKHQVCDNIGNIALWYFASLNRIVGQAIFEREKTKENDSKIQFDAFVKNDINSTNPSEHQKIYLFSINSRTKAQIKEYPWLLSSLLSKFSMNETTGDCEVLPFDEMHTQLKNIKQNVKAIANSQEKHVFGDVVSYCICFGCLYFVYLYFCFYLYLIVCSFAVVPSCNYKDCMIQLMSNTNKFSCFSARRLCGCGIATPHVTIPSFSFVIWMWSKINHLICCCFVVVLFYRII